MEHAGVRGPPKGLVSWIVPKYRIMMTAVGAVIALLLGTADVARHNPPPEHVALGNKERDARNPTAALQHYEAAIAADLNEYDALRNAACERGARRIRAERRTPHRAVPKRRTVRASRRRGKSARGRRTLSACPSARTKRVDDGVRDRIEAGERDPSEALAALAIDAKHSGALHVMGLWNAEIMRVNGFSRTIARHFSRRGDLRRGELERRAEVSGGRRRGGFDAYRAPPGSGGGLRGPRSAREGDRTVRVDRSRAGHGLQRSELQNRRDAPPHGATLTAELVTHVSQHLAAPTSQPFGLAGQGPSRVLTALWRGEQGGRRAEQCPDSDAGGENQHAIRAISVHRRSAGRRRK
jgi:hypothetical protein